MRTKQNFFWYEGCQFVQALKCYNVDKETFAIRMLMMSTIYMFGVCLFPCNWFTNNIFCFIFLVQFQIVWKEASKNSLNHTTFCKMRASGLRNLRILEAPDNYIFLKNIFKLLLLQRCDRTQKVHYH